MTQKLIPSQDIRQSDKWAAYMKSLNWNAHRTNCGANILFIKSKIGTIVKIQRPSLLDKKDLAEIEVFCLVQKAMSIKIEPFVGQDIKALEEAGYIKSYIPMIPPSTIYIDLTKSEEELWNNISHSGQYSIKRAQREDVKIRFYQNPLKEKLEPYFLMCKETGSRKHFYIQPFKDLMEKVKLFGKSCHLVLAYDKAGNLMCGKFYLCDGDMVLYSTGGSSKGGMKSKAGYELLWKSILYFKGLGYKVLDLEGKDDERFLALTRHWGGFSYFKEKFGGEVVEFPYPYIKYLSPVLKFMNKFFRLPL